MLQEPAAGCDIRQIHGSRCFENAEGFAGVIGAHHIGGVENVAQLIAAEAEEMDIEGIEFGAQQRSAFGFENEG